MDNNGGGHQATAEELGIELMKQELAVDMLEDIEAALQCLNESAGGITPTIFRVPKAIGGGIAEACQPRIVSIGPYHHGESQLEMLQGLKWRYLDIMLGRIQPHGIYLKNLIDVVALKEKMIRQCYSESTDNFSGPDLVRMMVLDGCFIIEFLRQLGMVKQLDEPLSYNIYVSGCVMQDLLRLENQVPYFVLEDLFGTTNVPEVTLSLADLIFNLFRCFLKGRGNVRERRVNLKGVHLLDAFRQSLIPWDQQDDQVDDSSSFAMIRSASELRQVGIGFEQRRKASTFLEIKFDRKRRMIGIPNITVDDDDLNWILRNMVAFEQCRGGLSGCHVTAYAMFMGCLIHTIDDVQLLRDCKVISNHSMSNGEFARFFDDIRKGAPFEAVGESHLKLQFVILNESLNNEWADHCCAQLLNAFHDNPWSALSSLAVIVTLVGIIQTVYALPQYYHPQ